MLDYLSMSELWSLTRTILFWYDVNVLKMITVANWRWKEQEDEEKKKIRHLNLDFVFHIELYSLGS